MSTGSLTKRCNVCNNVMTRINWGTEIHKWHCCYCEIREREQE